jgi:hypothetical protein
MSKIAAENPPPSHVASADQEGIDITQLVDHFRQLEPCKRRVVLALVAAAVRLKGGAA